MKNYDYIGGSVALVISAMQTEHVFQLIGLILSIISIVFSLSYTVYKWYKEAKQDGKITREEVDDLIDEVSKSAKQVNKEIDDFKKGGK